MYVGGVEEGIWVKMAVTCTLSLLYLPGHPPPPPPGRDGTTKVDLIKCSRVTISCGGPSGLWGPLESHLPCEISGEPQGSLLARLWNHRTFDWLGFWFKAEREGSSIHPLGLRSDQVRPWRMDWEEGTLASPWESQGGAVAIARPCPLSLIMQGQFSVSPSLTLYFLFCLFSLLFFFFFCLCIICLLGSYYPLHPFWFFSVLVTLFLHFSLLSLSLLQSLHLCMTLPRPPFCSYLLLSISTPASLSLSVSWLWFLLISFSFSVSLSFGNLPLSATSQVPPLLSDSPQPEGMVLLARL